MSYAMRGAQRTWGMSGLVYDSSCGSGSLLNEETGECACPSDSIMIGGACKDPSTLCSAGTQWVAKDNACVPITKYMSPAQIRAAVTANVPAVLLATTGSATPRPTAAPVKHAVAPVPGGKNLFALIFSGPNAPWVIGGLAVGAVGLAVLSRKKTDHRRSA